MARGHGEWIVIAGTITGYRAEYTSDLRGFSRRSEAVVHGFTLGRLDDFNVGFVCDGQLGSLWWMDKQVSESAATLARIGAEIGLRAHV